MQIYSKMLFGLGILNIVSCSVLNVYYVIAPLKFSEGTTTNALAFLIGFFASFIMAFLTVIYYLLGNGKIDLYTFNVYTIPFYIIFGFNVAYRLFFNIPQNDLGSSTPAKIIASLAIGMLLNFIVVIMSYNYLKINHRQVQ